MDITDGLMQDHRVIERVLDALALAADRMDRGEPVPARFFADCADFAAGFADGCHHLKEEHVLFPAITAAGVPAGGPVSVMLHEHDEGRSLIRALREAARAMDAGDATVRAELVGCARDYVALLRSHIAKEDHVLFPMARQVIDPAAQARVAAAFEDIAQTEACDGSQDRYLALADALSAEAGEA
ncbi:MAG: hemerythrin domain-containing protein [Ardenticatenales bacterium]|nr:hemerythrin domain-containing protein [Ardenticatenales bacterium]